jgi:K+-transporting ATPase ATPase C chain
VTVQCAQFGTDYTALGFITPIRGDAPAKPAVPADAVTASGSGLDPQISPAYAELQAPRVAKARGVNVGIVDSLIKKYTVGRALGFMGEPAVDVLQLNVALDNRYPVHS